jgi:hypothetical protein
LNHERLVLPLKQLQAIDLRFGRDEAKKKYRPHIARACDHEELNQSFDCFRYFALSVPDTEMKSITNKSKKNEHDGRIADRRKRRARPNLRIRAGQRVRAVPSREKRPAFRLLTIANVPRNVLEGIDELAGKQGRGRSSFVRHALHRIVADYRVDAEEKSQSKSRVSSLKNNL